MTRGETTPLVEASSYRSTTPISSYHPMSHDARTHAEEDPDRRRAGGGGVTAMSPEEPEGLDIGDVLHSMQSFYAVLKPVAITMILAR